MLIDAISCAVRRIAPVLMGLVLATMAVVPALAEGVPLTSLMSPAEGTWRTQNGTEVTVAPCPTGQGLCGTLSWVLIPKANSDQCKGTDHAAFASLMMDYKNPDKAQQTRPVLGLNMMQLTPTNDPTAFTVRVYNPEDGSTNDGQLYILNNGQTLRIGGGCVNAMCVESQDWPKVPDREGTPDFSCDGGQ